MKKKMLLLISIFPMLTGCNFGNEETITPVHFNASGFFEGLQYHTPLNTAVDITMYNQNDLNEISDSFNTSINALHKNVDAYFEYKDINNIHMLNENPNTPIRVDDSLFTLLEKGIELTKLTKGSMNILMGSTIDLWKEKFDSLEKYSVDPDASLIAKSLLSFPSYVKIEEYIVLNKSTKEVTLVPLTSDTKINLGAIAKGFALDYTSSLFKDKPAIVSAGSSSLRLNGSHPNKDRDYYIVSLKEPIYHNVETNSSFINLKVDPNSNISTSGDYEKFFMTTDELGDTVLRNHILDPKTGYSSNYHAQVCVASSLDGVILDALSTALMNIESQDEIKQMVTSFENYYNAPIAYGVFDRITDATYSLTYNELFKNNIHGSISKSIKEQILK